MKTIQTLPTAKELAAEFCRCLRAELTADELADVVQTNRLETSPNICHSHDYCDANQTMLDAMAKWGLDFDAVTEGLINEAWELAKKAGFSL